MKKINTGRRESKESYEYLVGIGDEDGWHVESRPVEVGPLAQLLDDLHHDPLPVRLVSGLVGLAQVEPHPLGMLLTQLLHDVQRTLAQGLRKKRKTEIF